MARRVGVILTGFLVLGLAEKITHADVVFRPMELKPAQDFEDNENFPESRFGQAPVNPDLGARSGVPGRSLASTGGARANRAPAGMGMQEKVIADPDMPRSPSNLNPKPGASSENQPVQELALIAGDLGFFPRTLFVTRDIPVKLFVTGASKRSLCLMSDVFQIRKQIRSQKIEEINFTATASGQYRFYCPINGMEGTVLVKEISNRMAE